jgi:cytochrome c oxidase cbb3-type subunit 3
MNKIAWIVLLLLNSSCFKQKPQKIIDFKDNSDFNEIQFKLVKEDTGLIATTSKLYSTYCISCHGHKALGGAGPNLTDSVWKNGSGSVQDIYKILRYGIAQNGMRAFEKTLSDKQLMAMSIYIKSLKVK